MSTIVTGKVTLPFVHQNGRHAMNKLSPEKVHRIQGCSQLQRSIDNACTSTCTPVHGVYLYIHVHLYRVYLYIHVHLYSMYMYLYIHVHLCRVYIYTCMYTCTGYICAYTCRGIFVYTCTVAGYTCICTCMYTCTGYICTYMYTCENLYSSVPYMCMWSNSLTAFFRFNDHGMGIVSLHAQKYPGFRMRMHSGTLQGKVTLI